MPGAVADADNIRREVQKGPTEAETSAMFADCHRGVDDAQSREEFEAAKAECDTAEANAAQNDGAIVRHGNLELVSDGELRAWWETNPFLKLPNDGKETLFGAWSRHGGRQGDPSAANAMAIQFLPSREADIYTDTREEFHRSGGVIVGAYSPATKYETFPFAGKAQQTTVRGKPGIMRVATGSEPDHRYRRLSWEEDGAWFDITNSADVYSDAQTMALAESLEPSSKR